MELFKGALHYRCAEEGMVETAGHPGTTSAPARSMLRLLSEGAAAADQADFDTEEFCAAGAPPSASTCEDGTACAYFDADGLGNGLTSFDNIGVSFIVLQSRK